MDDAQIAELRFHILDSMMDDAEVSSRSISPLTVTNSAKNRRSRDSLYAKS
jgi:hypothetical protein